MQERVMDAVRPPRADQPPVGPFGDVVAALQVIARRQAHDDASHAEVLESLRVVMRIARVHGLSAAQVIVAAKAAWCELPEIRQRHDPARSATRLERLVSLCIDAYYA